MLSNNFHKMGLKSEILSTLIHLLFLITSGIPSINIMIDRKKRRNSTEIIFKRFTDYREVGLDMGDEYDMKCSCED